MAIRTKLLNWNNITRDTDFSKFIQTVSEPWVIEGFTVTANSVAVGQARVPCERTNGETLYALIYNTAPVSISGNGEVYILVNQTYIDDWELANEDGTGIATIQVGTTPSKNALKLATITGGVVTDNRNIIPKVWELRTYIQSLQQRMSTAEQEIDELIAEKSVDRLEEAWLIGEKYVISDSIFRQKTPSLANATLDRNIGDVASNTQVHIQRLGSWTASNKLKICAKKIWAPTTWLVVEVRRGVQVDVSSVEAYWYWSDLVCSWSIPYSSFSTDYQEFEITMNGQFGWTKGELLDIVVYQTGNIVNSTNYYAIGCDSTQFSEWFSLVAVNGTTRTRSKYCPYCIGTGFADKMLCKTATAWSSTSASVPFSVTSDSSISSSSQHTITVTYTVPQSYNTLFVVISYNVGAWLAYWGEWGSIVFKSWTTTVWTISPINKGANGSQTFKLTNVASWTVLSAVVTSTQGTWQWGGYSSLTLSGNMSISASQSWIIRPLIPVEVKAIWQQGVWMSYWRKDDGTRYWDFDGEIHNSATTWSITPWNCLGFKIITDSNGEQYKIPIYWL